MTALVVTDDMVLRWPFAVNAARITSEMEADIGRRMAAQAKAEGHVGRVPPSKPSSGADLELLRAELDAEIARVLLDSPPKSINRIRTLLHRDRPIVEEAVGRMVRAGAIYCAGLARTGNGKGHAKLYALTPMDLSGLGRRDPALPGETSEEETRK